jgi:cytochrome c oxidase subunit 1
VPLAVGGFGNFVLPLQIGAPDMAFPRINMMSYWAYFLGGVTMLTSFFVPGGAAQSGWTSYSPLAELAGTGQTMWLIGMVMLITSSLLGAINFLTTTVQLRAKGLTFWRFPFFVWAQFVPRSSCCWRSRRSGRPASCRLMDSGGHQLLPAERPGGERAGSQVSGGGNPLLWQHLFWFPSRVYVPDPAGHGDRRGDHRQQHPQAAFGYRTMVYSLIFLRFMSFVVWAHHMFHDGMGTVMSAFFQTTDDHLDPVGGDLTSLIIFVGRLDPLQHADAVRAGLPADVRHRRADRAAARAQRHRHPAARHYTSPTSTTSSPRHDLRLVRGIYYWFPRRPAG